MSDTIHPTRELPAGYRYLNEGEVIPANALWNSYWGWRETVYNGTCVKDGDGTLYCVPIENGK